MGVCVCVCVCVCVRQRERERETKIKINKQMAQKIFLMFVPPSQLWIALKQIT